MAKVFNWELCSIRFYLTLTIVSIHSTTWLNSFIRIRIRVSTCSWDVRDVNTWMRGRFNDGDGNDETKLKTDTKLLEFLHFRFKEAFLLARNYVVNSSSGLDWTETWQHPSACKYLFYWSASINCHNVWLSFQWNWIASPRRGHHFGRGSLNRPHFVCLSHLFMRCFHHRRIYC